MPTSIAVAQFAYETKTPTPFDKFVTDDDIEWAAYISDTVRFSAVNFNEYLRKRFEKDEIKSTPAVEPRSAGAQNVQFKSRAEVLAALPPDVHFDSLAKDLVDVVQILYVDEGRLKTHNAWVSPKYSVITPEGTRLGFANYFSTAFAKQLYKPRKLAKLIFLGSSTVRISLDSMPRDRMLKETFGRNLLETIWPTVFSGVAKLTFSQSTVPINATSLSAGIFEKPNFPVYDSSGNEIGTKAVENTLPLSSFDKLILTQDWYYDRKRNLLHSFVKSAELVNSKAEVSAGISSPTYKIIFN